MRRTHQKEAAVRDHIAPCRGGEVAFFHSLCFACASLLPRPSASCVCFCCSMSFPPSFMRSDGWVPRPGFDGLSCSDAVFAVSMAAYFGEIGVPFFAVSLLAQCLSLRTRCLIGSVLVLVGMSLSLPLPLTPHPPSPPHSTRRASSVMGFPSRLNRLARSVGQSPLSQC